MPRPGGLRCYYGLRPKWTFTYPANQATNNWTVLPPNWQDLRSQWEYSHATGAGLNFIALITLIVSVLVREER
jgi:hypothetical protein